MNTFIVKSHHPEFDGRYIGDSTVDNQPIYAFRSNQVFRELNPDRMNYTIVGKLSDEFDFRKNNICPHCAGEKVFYKIKMTKTPQRKIINDKWGYPIFLDEPNVHCICGDGSYIGHLEHELEMEKRYKEQGRENYNELKGFIEKTSTCETCKGIQSKTLLMMTCNECGLPGSGFWPG